MCLEKIEWQGDPVYHRSNNPPTKLGLDIQHGWKIFHVHAFYKGEYGGSYYGGPYKTGQWYLAQPKLIHSDDNDRTAYRTGFHAYCNREDVILQVDNTYGFRVGAYVGLPGGW